MNKYGNYLQLNPGATTAAMDNLWLASEDFADNLNSLKHIQQHTINSVTWQGIMHSFTKVVVFWVFTSITITIIRLGHNIIGISPVILVVEGSEAYQFNRGTDSISYWDTVVHDPLNPIINTILIITGFVIVVGIIKFKWFIKLRVISHYGVLEGSSRKYENNDHLIMNIILNTKHWLNGYIREIVIKYPLSCLDTSVNIGNVSIIGATKLWFIKEKNGELLFSTISPVRFSIDLQIGGKTIRAENINFRLSSINWMEGGKPIGFDKANVHGVCHLDYIRTYHGSISELE